MSAHKRARRTFVLVAAGFLAGVIATVGLNLGSRVEAISFWGEQSAEPAATPTAAPKAQGAVTALARFCRPGGKAQRSGGERVHDLAGRSAQHRWW